MNKNLKLLFAIGAAISFYMLAKGQAIVIPASQFPISTNPPDEYRVILVNTNGNTPGATSAYTQSNATTTVSDLRTSMNKGATVTNASVIYEKLLPRANLSGGVGMIKYAAPFTITNTLSYGFTNLHVWDNVVVGNVQLEIIKFVDGHTANVFEPVQNSDAGQPFYLGVASPYDVYVNSANLYDVNGEHIDTTGRTHGAITSDGGLAVATGLGAGDSQAGWSYGVRYGEGTNSWRVYAVHLGAYGPGLSFEVGGDNSGNPLFLSALAPYESLSVFPDGSVSVRGGLTNRFGDLPISTIGKLSLNATNGIDANGLLSVKQSSRFLPQANLVGGTGQINFAGQYTITNTLAYGFTNLHVWDNLVVGNNQLEVIAINNASNITVFEGVQNTNSGANYYFGGSSNYNVYYNAANLYDVNGDQPDYLGHTHGAITSDGALAVGTGQYQAGWSFGLRVSGLTNSWRISADNLSGPIGPCLNFLSGGCNTANPFVIATLAPSESLDIMPDGSAAFRGPFTNRIGTNLVFNSTLEMSSNLLKSVSSLTVFPSGNDGTYWNSNKVLFWVTATKTNVISDGR